MKNHHSSSKTNAGKTSHQGKKKPHYERPHFSQAVLKAAKDSLKEFESQSDEAFLERAKINRKLSSL